MLNYADAFYQASLTAAVSRHSVEKELDRMEAGAATAVTAAGAGTAAGGTAAANNPVGAAACAASYADTDAALARWRSDLSRDFLSCLGGSPWQCPLNIQRGEQKRLTASAFGEIAYSGGGPSKREYTRERIVFEAEAGLLTPAYLLVPDGADESTPVIIALEGHGFGVADIVGLNPDGTEQAPGESGYHKAFAVGLAQRGFVVIAPELMGFGELRLERDIKPDNPRDSSCNAISSMLLMIGRTMAGVRVNQARRCIDALASLGYKQNPMMMGISGGGLVCAYTAALDERVRACCVSGFANTYRGCFLAMHHCVDCFQPGLLLTADMPDILSLIAPRPMIWESGEDDPIFPIADVMEAERIVRRVYKAYGKDGDFVLDRFPADHQIHGVVSYDFLWKYAV
jgi:dienelactone hydrolase